MSNNPIRSYGSVGASRRLAKRAGPRYLVKHALPGAGVVPELQPFEYVDAPDDASLATRIMWPFFVGKDHLKTLRPIRTGKHANNAPKKNEYSKVARFQAARAVAEADPEQVQAERERRALVRAEMAEHRAKFDAEREARNDRRTQRRLGFLDALSG